MAALTLVMKELADLDPEEFFNVRAYYSGGKDFRQVLRRARPPSPTSSESSGISSLTTSSTGDEESATSKSSQSTKSDCYRETTKMFQPLEIIKRFDTETDETNNRILYCGRDILNLERNTQPFKWQLTSPLFCFLNSRIPAKYRSYLRLDEDPPHRDYPMKTCLKCGFTQPSTYL